MTTETIYHTVSLTSLSCGNCEIVFAMPSSMLTSRKHDGGFFYCPNGHNICYSDSANRRLKLRVESLEGETADLRERNEQWKHKEAAARGVATRAKNRARAGVCQFCNRTFQNVARHVQSKHV